MTLLIWRRDSTTRKRTTGAVCRKLKCRLVRIPKDGVNNVHCKVGFVLRIRARFFFFFSLSSFANPRGRKRLVSHVSFRQMVAKEGNSSPGIVSRGPGPHPDDAFGQRKNTAARPVSLIQRPMYTPFFFDAYNS
ncbi:hypothetical protein AA313_de0206466 [Arthrobotrys entomopaga]|nr:hypothetical protein AA313_de0206466 [Arthrobotrys entomopaga]